jgi:hypothetical protein
MRDGWVAEDGSTHGSGRVCADTDVAYKKMAGITIRFITRSSGLFREAPI